MRFLLRTYFMFLYRFVVFFYAVINKHINWRMSVIVYLKLLKIVLSSKCNRLNKLKKNVYYTVETIHQSSDFHIRIWTKAIIDIITERFEIYIYIYIFKKQEELNGGFASNARECHAILFPAYWIFYFYFFRAKLNDVDRDALKRDGLTLFGKLIRTKNVEAMGRKAQRDADTGKKPKLSVSVRENHRELSKCQFDLLIFDT